MRELPVTVALSLLVHVGALAWFATRPTAEEPRRLAAKVDVIPPTPEPEIAPVEVALLDDDTVRRFSELPTEAISPRTTSRHAPAIAATTTTRDELPPPIEQPPPTTTEPPKKKSALSMRDGRPEPQIHRPGSEGISDEALEAMVNGDVPVRIANVPGAREKADFDRAQSRIHDPRWVERATPEQVAAARFDSVAAREAQREVELVEQKDGTHTSEKRTFKARVNRDGTVDFKDKSNVQLDGLGLSFDTTDAIMRATGTDPYASEKLRYLDRTRDQRVEIGKRYRSEQLAQSAQIMAQNLARLWQTTPDPTARKEALFALWDECAEAGDAELVAGGAAARRLLINWVHTKKIEFSRDELVAFNAKKQSKATFAP